jgi:hypothetical protein
VSSRIALKISSGIEGRDVSLKVGLSADRREIGVLPADLPERLFDRKAAGEKVRL